MVGNLAVLNILHRKRGIRVQQLAVEREITTFGSGLLDIEDQVVVKRVRIRHRQHVGGQREAVVADLAIGFQLAVVLDLIVDQDRIVIVVQHSQGDHVIGLQRCRRAAAAVLDGDGEIDRAEMVFRFATVRIAIGQQLQVGDDGSGLVSAGQQHAVIGQGADTWQGSNGVAQLAVIGVGTDNLPACAGDDRQIAAIAQADVLLAFNDGDATRHAWRLVDRLELDRQRLRAQAPTCTVIDRKGDVLQRGGSLAIGR